MKILTPAILFFLLLSNTVLADDLKDAETLIKSKLDAVISVLHQKELSQQVRDKKVIDIVSPAFDFSLMAKLSLGKKHWRGLVQDKKDRFTELFIEQLKTSYLEKLTLYTDETIEYKPSIKIKAKIHVSTELVSKDNRIAMLYKLYKSKTGWKIYDLEIQGVSIISTYRSQFNQVLAKGTIDDVLKKLEKKEIKDTVEKKQK